MSLLSSTQGTPERVWSLVSALHASGGAAPRPCADDWLNPGFLRREVLVQEKADAVVQTVNAATSLGAIIAEGGSIGLAPACPGADERDFRDWAYDRLTSLASSEKDAVVLEAYAWMAAESDREGSTGWMSRLSREAFADAADKALPDGADDDGQRRVNTTKMPALRRWLEYLGLMTTLPVANALPHPAPTARLARELQRDAAPVGEEIPAQAFLSRLARRLPYLDGGRMFEQTAQRLSHKPDPRRLSPLLSLALHDLHDAGAITLGLRGDAGDIFHLSPGLTHRVQSIQFVVINGAIQ